MMGNYHVQLLGGNLTAMPVTYPVIILFKKGGLSAPQTPRRYLPTTDEVKGSIKITIPLRFSQNGVGLFYSCIQLLGYLTQKK